MDCKWTFNFLIVVASMLSVACLSSAFDPSDSYLINCGSNVSATVGKRVFIADSSALFLSNLTDTLAFSSPNSSVGILYQTARIFPGNSSSRYTFPITQPGRHLIRLHFFPFAHGNYNMSLANFSVSTQSHPLVANFNPMGASMKEYSVYLSLTTLLITFIPSTKSFAFVNALEVVSVPEFLIAANASVVNNAFLNGVEIMKMNNFMGSLRGVANVKSSSNAGPMNNVGLVAGVTVVVLVVVLVVAALLFWVHKRRNAEHRFNGTTTSAGSNLGLRFPLAAVLEATNNFRESLVVGSGGFGNVYRGTFTDSTIAAVKRANPRSQQGLAEFQNEIKMLSQLRHQHLVSLIGYCDERDEMILIYEYMGSGTLTSHLYGSGLPSLGWKERFNICIGVAKGIEYLHENAVIHRDVKCSNILLDENLSAKVSDLGFAMSVTELEQTHLTTNVNGTFGYLDPEYALTRKPREKSDVYSFGVVLFVVLCGRPVIDLSLPREMAFLPQMALEWQRKGEIEQVIDPYLVGKIRPLSLAIFAETAASCLAEIGFHRPSMGDIIWNLERALQFEDEVPI